MTDFSDKLVVGSAANVVGLFEPGAIDDAQDTPERAIFSADYLREALDVVEFLGWQHVVVSVEVDRPLGLSEWQEGAGWGEQQADVIVAPRAYVGDDDPREAVGLEPEDDE